MYAFRKPFTAGVFADLSFWGVDYKIILVITQVLGYALSKFIGIKVVSEMTPAKRVRAILVLIGIAWVSLLFFGLVPYPYNFIFLFFNGIPLGMIWGLVFSFLEGRRFTELLGAGMSTSFIVSSGFVKAIGLDIVNRGFSEFWMPFLSGALFVPLLFLGVWMLAQIPPPNAIDEAMRTKRVPMDGKDRLQFFKTFATGIILLVIVFIALTIFRDIRDNFVVDLWKDLGMGNQPQLLVLTEIPIAFLVMVMVGSMMFIRSNRLAFFLNIGILIAGGILLVLFTWLFKENLMSPVWWMIITGMGMYIGYIAFHTMLFERWIALFRYQSNIGFLMYVSDAFGYLGSVAILFYKNFGASNQSWLSFFLNTSYITGSVIIVFSLAAGVYFWGKERRVVAG